MSSSKLPQNSSPLFTAIIFLSGVVFSGLAFVLVQKFTPYLHTQKQQDYTIDRVQGLKNINPILSIRPNDESRALQPLKKELNTLINSMTAQGDITQMSIYLQNLDQGDWMDINADAQFHPASLMKVALLICYLRMAETTPGLLEQELLFEAPEPGKITTQFYQDLSIEPGKKYPIHQLLYYMIAQSDNNATWLLSSRFDVKMLYKLFDDLGLEAPSPDEAKFTMTARAYSALFNAIYNSAYLTPEYSDYAAELLRNCTFSKGFMNGIGASRDTMMWHKFGEWRFPGFDYELHESGVIHVKGKAYLLTIMTKGKDTNKLAEVISQTSKLVYETLASP